MGSGTARPWFLAALLIVAACGGGNVNAAGDMPPTDQTAAEVEPTEPEDEPGPEPEEPDPEEPKEPDPEEPEEPAAADPSSDGVVTLTLADWSIVASHPVSEVGDLEFTVDNDARGTTHEVLIVETRLPADALPLGPKGDVDEESSEITVLAELRGLGYDTSTAWSVTLAPGAYVVVCNLPAHYRRGMWSEFEVLPIGSPVSTPG